MQDLSDGWPVFSNILRTELQSKTLPLNLPSFPFFFTSIEFWWLSCAYKHAESLQLCLTLCNPMDYSPPRLSVHGTRILEWASMPSSRGSSWPRDRTRISCGSLHPGRWVLYHWATWEAQGEASLSLFYPRLYLFALLAGSHNTPCFVGAPHSHRRGGGFFWGPSECQKTKDVAPTLFLCLECPTITSSFPGTIILCRMWRCIFSGLLQRCPATAERWFW